MVRKRAELLLDRARAPLAELQKLERPERRGFRQALERAAPAVIAEIKRAASSTDYYTSGKFDAALMRVLERIDQVMAVMLPSLREERAASYSPFLPICPRTGVVLQVPITAHDVKGGTISYDDPETKESVTLPVTGGHCKLQWKPDWAMRWFALGVDYEMAGKDLIDSVKLSGKICAALGDCDARDRQSIAEKLGRPA